MNPACVVGSMHGVGGVGQTLVTLNCNNARYKFNGPISDIKTERPIPVAAVEPGGHQKPEAHGPAHEGDDMPVALPKVPKGQILHDDAFVKPGEGL